MKNCWEILKCNHTITDEKGHKSVCPAYSQKMGHICWVVAGTFCKEMNKENKQPKNMDNCLGCEVYRLYSLSSGENRDKLKTDYPEEFAKYIDIQMSK